jgi:hypothetical protein
MVLKNKAGNRKGLQVPSFHIPPFFKLWLQVSVSKITGTSIKSKVVAMVFQK